MLWWQVLDHRAGHLAHIDCCGLSEQCGHELGDAMLILRGAAAAGVSPASARRRLGALDARAGDTFPMAPSSL